MQIITYRGPSQPGGVATLIQRADCSQSTWWHIKDGFLHAINNGLTRRMASIPQPIAEGHYRYSNEYLWPLMHSRGDLARYNEIDRNCYRSMNLALATHLNWHQAGEAPFVHDYQLALIPHYLSDDKSERAVHFWHIPWPERFPKETVEHVAELAGALLCCRSVGFHTAEYVENFSNFVRQNIPDVRVASDGRSIVHKSGKVTTLLVSPGGVNYSFWHASAQLPTAAPPCDTPYILSVDRADYTKGLAERIEAVRMLFNAHPELKGKFQFVFACQRTRPGIAPFDAYWADCRAKYDRVVAEIGLPGWSPILWLADPVTPQVLAGWYAHASAMLVNPSRDGLNLTAKEFIASARNPESTLILSRHAGAWHELQEHVVTIDECHPEAIADAILFALRTSPEQRRESMKALKRVVKSNPWEKWWQSLTNGMEDEPRLRLVASASGAA
jgi:trehalose-6-phosphate synthase